MFPDKVRADRADERSRQHESAGDRRRLDERADNQARVYGAARKSTPDVDGHKPTTRRVEFEGYKDCHARGKPQHLATIHPGSCDCDDADVDTTYRMCCVSAYNHPPIKVATLFDTGAHASFVNREVAEWIGRYPGPARKPGARKRGRQEEQNVIE